MNFNTKYESEMDIADYAVSDLRCISALAIGYAYMADNVGERGDIIQVYSFIDRLLCDVAEGLENFHTQKREIGDKK